MIYFTPAGFFLYNEWNPFTLPEFPGKGAMTMNEIVKSQFDAAARQYDRQRRQLIPCFDDFYGVAATLIRTDDTSPAILDLGAGTGLLTAFIRLKYPAGRFTLIDFSGAMLEQAKERFADAGANVRFLVGDYSTVDFAGDYDYIVSSLSIHHLPHPDKRALFRKIRRHLKPGGSFVNADQAAGSSGLYDAYYRELWETSIAASGLEREAIEASKERRRMDINATVPDQLAWLREAGFAEADCVYKYGDFAVFHATGEGSRSRSVF
jgi:tRNA (cmo5U34)-methyltransferase